MIQKRKTIVMKFGGTSVQDSNSITNVINIVKQQKARKLIVVSAIAKATNSLEEIARHSSKGNTKQALNILSELSDRHFEIIRILVKDKKLKSEAEFRIRTYNQGILKLIEGVSIIKELSLRTLDSFRIYGELMSSCVINFAMLDKGFKVILVDSREIIKTDNEFSRAYPDFKLTERNIRTKILPLLNRDWIILAQGFIASTTDGISTTMGRESSDFSAAVYGSLLNAKEIQIWTDVDGILTADPGIVNNPLKLSQISFSEMEELSNFGAKVLHKNSVQPAELKNIPLRILNSKNLSSSGTNVSRDFSFHNKLKSITYKENIIVLRLRPKDNLNQYVFWEMMLNILNRHKPQIDLLISSNNAIIIVIAVNNYTRIHYGDLKNEFEEISDYKIIRNKVLLTLIGSDLNHIDNLEMKIFSALPNLHSEAVSFGFNRHSFSILVDNQYYKEAIRKLHNKFFEKNIDSNLFSKIKTKGR